MKTYRGFRDSTGRAHVTIDDGGVLTPLPHLVRHSPDGYEWNYAGSGPADLARSLLADVLGFPPHSGVYQRFKFTVVAQLPHDEWRLPEQDIRDEVPLILRELGVTCPRCLDRGVCDDDRRLVYCDCRVGQRFVEEEAAIVGPEREEA